ncbi:hypothetical protein [Aestuariispira insulae]|uniref:Uncharacterized protein n=1 Tax=Aestuariispira insulae TaxID=1461337 RepID=A0A3D9HI33_9PROT|nr:hypothetical protein [Aestuariispira insulae]RED49202.1 hypothetical protein DFP90_106180 [Aestuariispira insulae]
MTDLAGVGGNAPFDPGQVTRTNDTNRQAEQDRLREDEERTRAEDTGGTETRRVDRAEDTATPPEARATQQPQESDGDTARGFQPSDTEDTVTISAEAQQAARQNSAPPPATPAAGEVDATGFQPANDTNQATRQENSTTVVNGNQDQESEQTRALGQIVDQFA